MVVEIWDAELAAGSGNVPQLKNDRLSVERRLDLDAH